MTSDYDWTDEAGSATRKPYITYAVIWICVAIFLYLNFAKSFSSYLAVQIFLMPPAPLAWAGAYWGLLTSAFVHIDPIHILFNMIMTVYFGKVLERTIGKTKLIVLIVTSAIISSGAQLAFSSETGIGFSGVVYAFFGYIYAASAVDERYRRIATPRTVIWLLGWLVLCIFLTATKIMNIGNAAHIAGFLFGFFVGHIFAVKTYVKTSIACTLILAAITVLSLTYMPWSKMWVEYHSTPDARMEIRYELNAILLDTKYKDKGLEELKDLAERGHIPSMNVLAWVRATDPEKHYRNGEEALKWAQLACEKDGWKTAAYIDTLAAAYAELEQWDEAIAMQEKAVAALGEEDKKDAHIYTMALQSYKNHIKRRE